MSGAGYSLQSLLFLRESTYRGNIMSITQSLIIAVGIIVAGTVMSFSQSESAQGKFVAVSQQTNEGVYIVNADTGAVRLCWGGTIQGSIECGIYQN